MRSIILFLPNLLLLAVGHAQPSKVTQGTLKYFENFQSAYVAARNVDVWLPPNYSEDQKYAVLYMHDGQMLFDSTVTWNRQEWAVDETFSKLLEDGKLTNCLVVGIWNGGRMRHSEYFPQKPFEALPAKWRDSLLTIKYSNSEQSLFEAPVQSDKYLKFIVTELKPFIDKTFSTHRDQQHTFIAGSSMGGLISMYAICEYPEVFGGAACLSTHWPGIFSVENNPIPVTFFNYLRDHLPAPTNHKIYFDYGTETLDAFYPQLQRQADETMKARGYSAKNWITKEFVGEDHSERAWRKRLDIPVLFLLGKTN